MQLYLMLDENVNFVAHELIFVAGGIWSGAAAVLTAAIALAGCCRKTSRSMCVKQWQYLSYATFPFPTLNFAAWFPSSSAARWGSAPAPAP